jgi:hypothetical protein
MSESIPSISATGGLDRIYDAVQTVVPGVTEPVMQQAVWDTIEEFCIQSTFFRVWSAWTMGAGSNEFDFNPIDANTVAFEIISVSGLSFWAAAPPAVLIDRGQPSGGKREGWAWLACKPVSLGCCSSLPSALVDRWYEGLKNGTLMRLFAQPAKPWSAMPLAQSCGTSYRARIREARDLTQRLYGGGAQPFSFPYFAQGRRKN